MNIIIKQLNFSSNERKAQIDRRETDATIEPVKNISVISVYCVGK